MPEPLSLGLNHLSFGGSHGSAPPKQLYDPRRLDVRESRTHKLKNKMVEQDVDLSGYHLERLRFGRKNTAVDLSPVAYRGTSRSHTRQFALAKPRYIRLTHFDMSNFRPHNGMSLMGDDRVACRLTHAFHWENCHATYCCRRRNRVCGECDPCNRRIYAINKQS